MALSVIKVIVWPLLHSSTCILEVLRWRAEGTFWNPKANPLLFPPCIYSVSLSPCWTQGRHRACSQGWHFAPDWWTHMRPRVNTLVLPNDSVSAHVTNWLPHQRARYKSVPTSGLLWRAAISHFAAMARITGKWAWFDKSSSHIFFALGGVTMVMRADKNRSLTLAMLKCTQHLGVVEVGFNFRIRASLQGTKGIRTGPVKDLQQLSLLPGTHILLQAEFASIHWGVCFVHDILLPGAAAVTGMCL